MDGVRSNMGEQYNGTDPISGVGGIYMEKSEPEVEGSGNVVSQIILDGIYIENTKAHGIYIDGPMLSSINNVRISGAGGHGIFINAGTTCNLNSVYVSSAHFAGVCLKGLSYSSVMNSAAETCSIGWWLRGCNSISVFNSGVEATKNLGFQPWGASGPYGLNLHTYASNGTTEVDIKDINSDYANDFRGTGYLISGGECISLFSPYCKDPGGVEEDNESDSKTRFFKITGGTHNESGEPIDKYYNWNSRIINPSLYKDKETTLINQFDIEDTYKVRNLRLEWDPEDNGVVVPTNPSDIVTNTTSSTYKAPLYIYSNDIVYIRCGSKDFDLSK